MPKLNAVLMVVLSLGVTAGAGYLALSGSRPDPDADRVARLIRQLGDDDPDTRRDAVRELRQIGPKAEKALDAAAKGGDERARELLAALNPPAPKAPEKAAPPADPPAPAGTFELGFQVVGRDPLQAYVRFHNGTKDPVWIAATRGPGGLSLLGFGFVEFFGPDGVTRRPKAEPVAGAAELVKVAPGQSLEVRVETLARPEGKGPWRARFVYDATEEGAYRALAAKSKPDAALLPAGRLASADVAVE